MINVRNIVKATLQEALFKELASNFMNVGPNVGLVEEMIGQERQLTLFDFSKRECVGIISMKQTSSRQCVMVNVASENGFGPLMYELGMMDIYPMGMTPDRNGNLTPKAYNVWKVFHDSRPDIRKVQILPGEKEYSERFTNGEESMPIVLNCLYFRTPSFFYKKLLNKGLDFQTKFQISPKEISLASREFFKNKYSSR